MAAPVGPQQRTVLTVSRVRFMFTHTWSKHLARNSNLCTYKSLGYYAIGLGYPVAPGSLHLSKSVLAVLPLLEGFLLFLGGSCCQCWSWHVLLLFSACHALHPGHM